MKVIKPVTFDLATMLYSSTAVETVPAWEGVTTFAAGAQVRDFDNQIWQSLAAGNVNNLPAEGSTWWGLVGPDNRSAMFDGAADTATKATGSLTVVLDVGAINSIYLGGVKANLITVTLRDGNGGPIIYEKTISLNGEYTEDWYQYFFWDPSFRRTQDALVDLPSYSTGYATVVFDSGVGAVEVGVLTFGRVEEIGSTAIGASAGIIDYSRTDANEFGVQAFVKRGYSKRLSARVLIQNIKLNRVQRLLYDLRATPAVWIGDPDPFLSEALIIYGTYRDFSSELIEGDVTICSLELEGLVS